jgi:hypothetical protein
MLDSTVVCRRALGCEWGEASKAPLIPNRHDGVITDQAVHIQYSILSLTLSHVWCARARVALKNYPGEGAEPRRGSNEPRVTHYFLSQSLSGASSVQV